MSNNGYKWYTSHRQLGAATGSSGQLGRLAVLAPTVVLSLLPLLAQAQATRAVSGKVVDGTGTGLPGVTVIVPGSTVGTSTGGDGSFQLEVPTTATALSFSFVGFTSQRVDITGKTSVQVTLRDDAKALEEVVVVGYGTVKKTDLTGAVSALDPKDFNKGTFASPDQLIQGRASGVQVTQNSGQPGGASTIKIRGNSAVTGTGQPLYVVDGVPLDGRSARPGLNTAFGDSPDSNPLNFLNPNDIESIDILKDASATAIYGSRAAYGVVIITTKKGKAGEPRLDVSVSGGFSEIMRRIEVLNANEFRQALAYYGASPTNDLGQSNDALGAILRTAPLQNYNAAISGGNENARYRLSLGYLDQQGIIKKTGFKKYSASFGTNIKFLESKRLGVDASITASQFREQLAPITNNGDFRGSLIGQALQWNPTDSLYSANGQPVSRLGSSVINPVAMQQYYNDNSRVTTALASISPYYKFTDWLEYRALVSANYSTGIRRTSIDQRLNISDYQRLGFAAIGNSELLTQQMTHTLTLNRSINTSLRVNALLGYEYQRFNNSGTNLSGRGPVNTLTGAPIGFGTYGLDYTNYLQFSNPSGRLISSYVDPITELQSYFGRAILNYKDRYLLTATLRADGSTKFGENNKYGYFPSVSAAWDISQEDFFSVEAVNQLKARIGYGRTGNQEFPAGSARGQVVFLPNNEGTRQVNNPNPDLKWQSDEQYDAGLDVALFNNRLTLTADYFYKRTTDLLYPLAPIQPAAPGGAVTWSNLDGEIVNKGVELIAGITALDNPRFGLSFNANATFVKNTVSGVRGVIQTGALSGQGLSGVTVEVIQSGLPINAFFTQQFLGLDPDTGQSLYADNGTFRYLGNPNPTALAGLSASLRFLKLSMTANFNGVFGNKIYNNTFNSVLNVSQIQGGKNIARDFYESSTKEALSNRLAPSSRFLESGNYVKLSNLTLSYGLGDVAQVFKGATVSVIGQNLFVLTKYRGFDPEINTNKAVNGVPSAGIDYTGYPTARTYTLALNFSL
ncbi:SusC/RagA family TonB-linked outer membrane protein [Hymenobacter sp. HSC-4F20]|uniref:SusC/RagA family TonB-linked outer membrane protein n=1 Tax=Hymenobacter sp. HSC-4F20 TaxID=2864135 RepID=UPI001C72B1A8|nr:SusC/RagA family TonB-linked outer membrane protein [Hymenobacter sp. HSC-4F20]MBX0290629.1 SusC/RagA family TonB-linked outer membrane protein [Hymenobacter sp. HSC-4F20]